MSLFRRDLGLRHHRRRSSLVVETLILVANSISCSRGRLQRSEPRAAGPGQWYRRPPVAEPHQVDRRRRQQVLKVSLRFTDVATLPQPAPPDRLLMCTFDAGPGRIPRPELLGRLLTASRLQRLVLLAGQ